MKKAPLVQWKFWHQSWNAKRVSVSYSASETSVFLFGSFDFLLCFFSLHCLVSHFLPLSVSPSVSWMLKQWLAVSKHCNEILQSWTPTPSKHLPLPRHWPQSNTFSYLLNKWNVVYYKIQTHLNIEITKCPIIDRSKKKTSGFFLTGYLLMETSHLGGHANFQPFSRCWHVKSFCISAVTTIPFSGAFLTLNKTKGM